jgi:hypothetical protein
MRQRCLCLPYASVEDFAEKLRDQLDIVMNKLDKSEKKAELWSQHAVLSELAAIETERKRHEWAMEKQRDLDQQDTLKHIRERYRALG